METVLLVVVFSVAVFLLVRQVRRSKKKSSCGGCSGCSRPSSCLLMVSLVLCAAGASRAADTVETWEVGATDVDMYLGVDGISSRGQAAPMTTFGEMMLGYGLVDRLSAHVGIRVESNEYFSEGTTVFSLGLFGTPLDTRHFDLDLFLALSGGDGEVELSPSVELNLDSDPEMTGIGLYLRAGVPINGREQPTEREDTEPTYLLAPRLELTIGAYYTVVAGHQILLEHDLLSRFEPTEQQRAFELGGLAVGYNVALGSALELISQLIIDLPQGDEQVAIGFMTGLIATLPSPR